MNGGDAVSGEIRQLRRGAFFHGVRPGRAAIICLHGIAFLSASVSTVSQSHRQCPSSSWYWIYRPVSTGTTGSALPVVVPIFAFHSTIVHEFLKWSTGNAVRPLALSLVRKRSRPVSTGAACRYGTMAMLHPYMVVL